MATKPAQIHSGSGHGRHDSNSRFSIARLIGSHRRERSASAESVVVEDGDRTGTKDKQTTLDDLELRRHVRAVTMGDERPLPVPAPARAVERHRHSADLG